MSRGPPLLPDPVGQDLVGLAEPPSWAEIFGFRGPLELEIGCGMGGFALAYTQSHPGVQYVAFEWRKKWAREVHRRAQALNRQNLRVIEADARREVPSLFAPNSISVIRLQFPDPWWKRAHQKRSILQPRFASILFDKCLPGGYFDFRTDIEDRAVKMIEVLKGSGFRNEALGEGLSYADPGEPPSSRERRYLASGQQVYRARLYKPTIER